MFVKALTADEECKRNPNIKMEDVEKILNWVRFQQHLPEITDFEASLFLSCYKGSVEFAKQLLDLYYTSRTHCPEFFKNRNPDLLTEQMKLSILCPLKVSENHKNTLFLGLYDGDPSTMVIEDQFKMLGMILDLVILKEGSSKDYQFIIDFSKVQMGHLLKMHPVIVKKAIFILEESLPINITHLHIINVIPVADKMLALIKPFVKLDLLQKIVFHTQGIESVFKHISKEYFPKDVGGEGQTFEQLHDQMIEMLKDNKDYFLEEEKSKRVNEKLRLGKEKSSLDLFGVEGNFKKLQID